MDKIYLTELEKNVILFLSKRPNLKAMRQDFTIEDSKINEVIRSLQAKGLAEGMNETTGVGYLTCKMTDFGIAYIGFNPTLENPKSEKELATSERKKKLMDYGFQLIIGLIIAIVSFLLGRYTSCK